MPVVARFDRTLGVWQVGLKTNNGFGVVVHIDPLTANVLRVIEAP